VIDFFDVVLSECCSGCCWLLLLSSHFSLEICLLYTSRLHISARVSLLAKVSPLELAYDAFRTPKLSISSQNVRIRISVGFKTGKNDVVETVRNDLSLMGI
jgi:hypothetical protein